MGTILKALWIVVLSLVKLFTVERNAKKLKKILKTLNVIPTFLLFNARATYSVNTRIVKDQHTQICSLS